MKELQDAETVNKEEYEKLIAAKRKEIDSAKLQISSKKEQKTAADEERIQTKQAPPALVLFFLCAFAAFRP